MCLLIRTFYKFNIVEAFETAVEIAVQDGGTEYVRGRVIYNESKTYLKWDNLRQELEKAYTVNPGTIHGLMILKSVMRDHRYGD